MFKYFMRDKHKVSVVVEFKPGVKSEKVISSLSDYVNKIILPQDDIVAEVDSVPSGYRVKYDISFTRFKYFCRNKYTKELAKLSDWLSNDKDCYGCLSRYQYNHVILP